MARVDIVIAKLPALIADRTDSLKLETAIRYVGDIIFDASQNRSGDKARALAKVLSGPSSPEQAQSREAILTLFRDGYLDRYAEYIAWRDIGLAAGISSDPAQIPPLSQGSAIADTPKVVVLTRLLNAPPVIQPRSDESKRIKSVEALNSSAPPARNDALARTLKTPTEKASNQPAREGIEQGARGSKESYGGGLTRVGLGGEVRDRSQGATASLELTSLEGPYRNPIDFAKKYEETPAGELLAKGFPCLLGFVPQISADERSVEWANPVTGDSFRDHGSRLTSGSPGRLAIRAMLELARADNWTSVAVKGSLRLQAFAEASAAELDRLVPISPGQGAANRSFQQIPRRSRLSRVFGMSATLFVLIQIGFGAAYIYSDPEIQKRLGIKSFIDLLQGKNEEASPITKRENPLEFSQLTLALSTREGTALAPPQGQFNDTDLTNARYLKWTATFKNLLAGQEGRDEKVEARFYDPNGLQIASSATSTFILPSQKTADFSAVALMPTMTDKPAGTYKVALYSDDKMLTQESFQVNHEKSPGGAEPAHTETREVALRRALDAQGYNTVHFRMEGDTINLWGTVPTEADRLKVQTEIFMTARIFSIDDHIQVRDRFFAPP